MYNNPRVSAFGRTLVAFQSLVLMFTLVVSSSPLMAYAQTEGEGAPAPTETTTTGTESSDDTDTDTDTSDTGEGEGEAPEKKTPPEEGTSKPAEDEGPPAMTEDEIRAEEEAAEDDFLNQPEESEDLGMMMRGFFHIPQKPKLHITKELILDGGGAYTEEDFSVTITKHRIILPDQQITVPFDADGEITVTLDPTINLGPWGHQYYSVEEVTVAGFTTTYDGDCDDLEVGFDDHAYCTVINDDDAPPAPQQCSIVSNTTDLYIEGNTNAEETFVHGAWASIVDAFWIWGSEFVENPSTQETQTFVKDFTVSAGATAASLTIAADNGAIVKINGDVVLELDPEDTNYNPTQTIDVLGYLDEGTNTLEITVTNLAYGTSPTGNPAGVIYKLDITGATCGEVESEPKAFLHATKVMCASEEYLPNRSGGADITATTAQDYIDEVNAANQFEVCWLEEGWEFEWVTATDSNTNPGDSLEYAGGLWTTFGATDEDGVASTLIPIGDTVWVREVLKAGSHPFSGSAADSVSAEMWCSTDVLNYDNWDWINPVEAGEHYYCVAFNAPEPKGEQCDPEAEIVLVSDTMTTDESGPASLVSSLHASWTTALSSVASWIWKESATSAADAANGATETFTRTFTIVGTPLDATLELAADNQYEVRVNGSVLATDAGEFNYGALETHTIPAGMLQNGANTIAFTITNLDHPDLNTPENNPAGLVYKVVVHENECEVPAPTQATVSATKVMCEAEEYLPNMAGGADITATTAADWVAQSNGMCWLEEGYDFQWAPNGTPDPEDNGTAPLGSPWTTFGPTDAQGLASAQVTVADAGGTIQVREVLKAGDTPFTGDANNVSAELFCASDVAGYDNWEWISNPQAGSTYHCVAFNVNPDASNPNDPEVTYTYATTTVRAVDLATDIADAYLTPDDWFFWNDEDNTVNNALGSFVTGPATAPEGLGSAQMSVSGTQRRNIATYQFKDVKLSDIETIRFSTYSHSAGNGSPASERSAYLNFNVDFANNDTWQRRLVYLPAANGVVVNDAWQTWDALDGGSGLWLYSGASWPAGAVSNGSIPGTTARSWNDILADYPNAETRSTDSWMGFRIGEPYADGFTGNVDEFVIGIKSGANIHTETYDFEPTEMTTSSETIVVTEANPDGWEFNSDRDTWLMGTGEYVSGPATAPLGDGSARLTTPTNDERTKLRKYLAAGTQISDITELRYWTYRAEPTGGALTLALQFDVDFTATPVDANKADARLVYEPYHTQQASILDDAWQEWDALDDAAGTGTGAWWFAGPNASVCPQANPCTWAELNAAYPDLQVSAKSLENTIDTQGAVLFKAGGSWAGFDGNVDKFVFGLTTGSNTHTTTYDFEPATTQQQSSGGGGGGGSRRASSDDGEVLGASTDACMPLLETYMSITRPNDNADVTDLQNFLNSHMNAALGITGIFDIPTEAAVHAFQKLYWQDVLQPWFAYPQYGITDADDSTGYVYKTTKWKINNIVCPGSEALPTLP